MVEEFLLSNPAPHTDIPLQSIYYYYQPSGPFFAKAPALLRLNSPRTQATIMHQCLVFPPIPPLCLHYLSGGKCSRAGK